MAHTAVARGPTSVARGLVPRAYPLRRPDAVAAPGRVDARHEAAHDGILRPAHGATSNAVTYGLPPVAYGLLPAAGVRRSVARGLLPAAGVRLSVAYGLLPAAGVRLSVARGLVPRAYPLRRRDAVAAPGRVDARHEAAHDGILRPAHGATSNAVTYGLLPVARGPLPAAGVRLSVAYGPVPRAYPRRRPDAVAAPERVDARHEAAHDGNLRPTHDQNLRPAHDGKRKAAR